MLSAYAPCAAPLRRAPAHRAASPTLGAAHVRQTHAWLVSRRRVPLLVRLPRGARAPPPPLPPPASSSLLLVPRARTAAGAASATAETAAAPAAQVYAGITPAERTASGVAPPLYGKPAVIVGGGPAGLATALMLARRGYTDVQVYERLPEPPLPSAAVWSDFEGASDRLYMIGLIPRGQRVLEHLGVLDRIDKYSCKVLGRKDWAPDTPVDLPNIRVYEGRSYPTRCIQRDRLAGALLEELRERYADRVRIHFDVEVVGVSWRGGAEEARRDDAGAAGGDSADAGEVCEVTLKRVEAAAAAHRGGGTGGTGPAVGADADEGGPDDSASEWELPPTIGQPWTVVAPLVVGSDGARSAVRRAMEAAGSPGVVAKKYANTNERVYRTVPLHWPDPEDGATWNVGVRTKNGVNIDCLPTREGPSIGVVLYRPGDEQVVGLKTLDETRAFFSRNFPQLMPALRDADLERFAERPCRRLPTFSYVGPALHRGGTTVLLGDAIHTVKPYFGQGVNSAFEDVATLERCLEAHGERVAPALASFSAARAPDAAALVNLSRRMDGGFFTFVLPLVVDAFMHRLAPWLFLPPVVSAMQNENLGYAQLAARKVRERVLQALLGGGLLAALGAAATATARFLWARVPAALVTGGAA